MGTISSSFCHCFDVIPSSPEEDGGSIGKTSKKRVFYDRWLIQPFFHLIGVVFNLFQYSEGSERCRVYWHDYLTAFKYCWVHCLSVFSVFFCTLAVFPGIHAMVKVNDEDSFLNGQWFTDVTCFLSFNLFALIGNFVSNWVQLPSPRFLWIPVWIRTLIVIPFFMLANFESDRRKIPILITNDYVFQIGAMLYAFTSGYFSSLCMMYSPKTAPNELMGHAARITAFFLVLGLVCGINMSLVLVKITLE